MCVNAHMNVTSAFSDILEKFGFYEMMVGVCTKGVRVHVYVSVGERKSSRERKRERERCAAQLESFVPLGMC